MDAKLDHGAIGNGRVLALVSPRGAIEWLCLPRFDSPSFFGCILDRENGGVFSIEAAEEGFECSMDYLENTNVLSTVHRRNGEAFEVIDFAPAKDTDQPFSRPAAQIIRLLRPLSGAPRVRVRFDPRPDYGRTAASLVAASQGITIIGAGAPVYLQANIPAVCITGGNSFVLDREISFILTHGVPATQRVEGGAAQELARTIAFWRRWVLHCSIPDIAPKAVIRSALALRLHIFDDTGAIIAAATTSIPEARGSGRTWDYRYCWLRDAAFTLRALDQLGQIEEAEGYLRFLTDLVFVGDRRIQPLYGIGGETDLVEHTLDHWSGWNGSGPVRIGNAAYTHDQHDVYGETVLPLSRLLTDPRLIRTPAERARIFTLVSRLVERAIEAAPHPDSGIWEFRSEMRHHTFSKVMCWVGIDRGARVASTLGHAELSNRWRSAADALRQQILERAFHKDVGAFGQTYGNREADASNYLMPAVGFVSGRDPRFLSTLEYYEKALVRDGLVLRYTNPDDFGVTTSAFLMCAFWRVKALAFAGRTEQALAEFDGLLARANALGLFSEDADPKTGEMLGNFPQAYTHAGLINAATSLATCKQSKSIETIF
ncbi:MAG: glycoside hydrolase family 15 protein [Planctomycetes bacterium]|nr:glycoside hydrolase family 15 protein [Planctomycetota bacterium]